MVARVSRNCLVVKPIYSRKYRSVPNIHGKYSGSLTQKPTLLPQGVAAIPFAESLSGKPFCHSAVEPFCRRAKWNTLWPKGLVGNPSAAGLGILMPQGWGSFCHRASLITPHTTPNSSRSLFHPLQGWVMILKVLTPLQW